MAQGKHPVGSYVKDVGECAILILVCIGALGFSKMHSQQGIDQANQTGRYKEPQNDNNIQAQMKAGEHGKNPVAKLNDIAAKNFNIARNYVQNHYPKLASLGKQAFNYTKHHEVKVTNVHLDNYGTGYLNYKGKTYRFQLAGVEAPSSGSYFERDNQTNIAAIVQRLTKSGSMRMTNVGGDDIDLYADGELVQDSLLHRGLMYTTTDSVSAHVVNDSMLTAQKSAKASQRGLWKIPGVVERSSDGTQTYNGAKDRQYGVDHQKEIADVNGKQSVSGNGGESLGQKIAHWFGRN